MTAITKPLSITATLFAGAIFGFFYAWVCSTMWGLDTMPPARAIEAMNAMNASVRNATFFPTFFGTPVVLALAALWQRRAGYRRASIWFWLAAATYLILGAGLTMAINVPMNEALAVTPIPQTGAEAEAIWQAYSGKWQSWNQMRTLASGAALLFACIGLTAL
ncbi:putative membrane protein [Litoreibacter ponti]|uniref:Putative membrane protein n=1 Tax=Litoreibacter ponti TaxID=1510457 RepID=A0A2T6BHM1_9RHOB|nr:anthrone oxygenase family protein [Litoreibacter ponti]PTX55554.1 putative membrane protein [Litoreibacter ponti]